MKGFVKIDGVGTIENFASGAMANGYFFVAVNAIDQTTKKRVADAETIADETRICLDRLKTVLAEKGLTLRDVVKANSFLTSNDYRADFWTSYKEYFVPGPYPARCTYVSGLPSDCRVQIDAIAVVR